jgi:hypothetical protein
MEKIAAQQDLLVTINAEEAVVTDAPALIQELEFIGGGCLLGSMF